MKEADKAIVEITESQEEISPASEGLAELAEELQTIIRLEMTLSLKGNLFYILIVIS